MIEYGYHSRVQLPNVAVQKRLNIKQFLESTCLAAGLPMDTWRRPDAYLYRFTVQTFREKTPEGPVEAIKFE